MQDVFCSVLLISLISNNFLFMPNFIENRPFLTLFSSANTISFRNCFKITICDALMSFFSIKTYFQHILVQQHTCRMPKENDANYFLFQTTSICTQRLQKSVYPEIINTIEQLSLLRLKAANYSYLTNRHTWNFQSVH